MMNTTSIPIRKIKGNPAAYTPEACSYGVIFHVQ